MHPLQSMKCFRKWHTTMNSRSNCCLARYQSIIINSRLKTLLLSHHQPPTNNKLQRHRWPQFNFISFNNQFIPFSLSRPLLLIIIVCAARSSSSIPHSMWTTRRERKKINQDLYFVKWLEYTDWINRNTLACWIFKCLHFIVGKIHCQTMLQFLTVIQWQCYWLPFIYESISIMKRHKRAVKTISTGMTWESSGCMHC